MGIASYHLNKPNQSLNYDENVVLNPKHVFYIQYYRSINDPINLFPKLYTSIQKQDREFLLGSDITYKINNNFDLVSGVYRRVKDAFLINLGLKKENLEVIFSYDINTSTLANASNTIGGVEFSITYGWSIIKERKELKKTRCPKYL